MDLQIPLNKLKFGHEDGDGINARVTGREDGIAELAANIFANRKNAPDRAGLIENLVVKDAGGGFYSVANGNRRLAALHMIDSPKSEIAIPCTLHKVDETTAFEFSLATAITAAQLHPVDQYEAFAKLTERGKTSEEIAQAYGMTEREVDQALALGHLSPRVRDLWRKGTIKAEVARAFTLAPDHAQQDKLLDHLKEEFDGEWNRVDRWDIRSALDIRDTEIGKLVEFVGIDAYLQAGGKVQRDLFGTDHRVSDPGLVKKLAAERLAQECELLKAQGWSFAVSAGSVQNTRHSFGQLQVETAPTEQELDRLASLDAIFGSDEEFRTEGTYRGESFAALSGAEQRAYLEYRALQRAIQERVYTPALRAKAGCFVGLDEDGLLRIEFGRVKPEEKKAAAKAVAQQQRAQAAAASGDDEDDAPAAGAKDAAKASPKVLSKALQDRLSEQLIHATRDALAADPLLPQHPLAEMMAKTLCGMITPDRPWHMPDGVQTKLPSLRQVLDGDVFNAAIAKRFNAEDYFGSAPKPFVVKAIAEAVNPDEARKVSAGSKNDVAKFAMANVVKTGWLPKELRTVHYKGPGSEGYKRPKPELVATSEPKASPAKAAKPVKRAAAAKKAAKKTTKKR